jgi:hypothetical protein
MRRLGVTLVLLGLVLGAAPVIAQEFPEHPHMLLQRPEVDLIDGVPHLVGVRKCVDLAGNRAVPLHAHHDRLHFGSSGVSFGGPSGHVVIPTAPLAPWNDCEDFVENFLPLDISD